MANIDKYSRLLQESLNSRFGIREGFSGSTTARHPAHASGLIFKRRFLFFEAALVCRTRANARRGDRRNEAEIDHEISGAFQRHQRHSLQQAPAQAKERALCRQLQREERRKLFLRRWCQSMQHSGSRQTQTRRWQNFPRSQPLAPGVSVNEESSEVPHHPVCRWRDRRSARTGVNRNKGGGGSERHNKARTLPCLHDGLYLWSSLIRSPSK